MTFFRVPPPQAMPGVAAALVIVSIPTVGDYVTPELMGGAGGKLIANMIQTQFLQLNNAPLGAAIALVAMAAVVTAILVIYAQGKLLIAVYSELNGTRPVFDIFILCVTMLFLQVLVAAALLRTLGGTLGSGVAFFVGLVLYSIAILLLLKNRRR